MKCKRLIIFSGLLLSLFFSFSLSSNTFAIDDKVIDIDINNYNDIIQNKSVVCDNSTDIFCSDYKYVLIEQSGLPQNCSVYMSNILSSGSSGQVGVISQIGYYNKIYLNNIYNFTKIQFNGSAFCSFSDYPDFHLKYVFSENDFFSENDCPESPTGNLDIIENGEYDVTNFSTATVNVPQSSETPYDNKLDQIIQAIYVCAGTMLVIYFFYCIYRMIIKGVKV